MQISPLQRFTMIHQPKKSWPLWPIWQNTSLAKLHATLFLPLQLQFYAVDYLGEITHWQIGITNGYKWDKASDLGLQRNYIATFHANPSAQLLLLGEMTWRTNDHPTLILIPLYSFTGSFPPWYSLRPLADLTPPMMWVGWKKFLQLVRKGFFPVAQVHQ